MILNLLLTALANSGRRLTEWADAWLAWRQQPRVITDEIKETWL